MSRKYSDPSYGSLKEMQLGPFTIGTRAAGNAVSWVATEAITVTDWAINNLTLGTGNAATLVLYKNSTLAIGTITMAGTHAANSAHAGSVTGADASLAIGDTLDFYCGLATTAGFVVIAKVQYKEKFDNVN